jgi:hypothetical protein
MLQKPYRITTQTQRLPFWLMYIRYHLKPATQAIAQSRDYKKGYSGGEEQAKIDSGEGYRYNNNQLCQGGHYTAFCLGSKAGYYAAWQGPSSTKSGMIDYLFENRPKCLLLDEIDKMAPKDQAFFLSNRFLNFHLPRSLI